VGVSTPAKWVPHESHYRLFDGTNNPPLFLVFDTESGKKVAQLEGVAGIDDGWYDAQRSRIHTSGGRESETSKPPGIVYVYQQKDADHHRPRPERDSATSVGSIVEIQ
jgi:hypothetical protein